MMLCGKCGHKSPDFSLYCEQCGSQVAEEKRKLPALRPHETSMELKTYIRHCLKSGYAMTQIKRALQREGYSDLEVQNAFVDAHKMQEAQRSELPSQEMQRPPNPDLSKHTNMLFVALIAIVVVGGFGLFYVSNQQNQVGMAIMAAQQQPSQDQDLAGEAIRLLVGNQFRDLEEKVTQQGDQLFVKINEIESLAKQAAEEEKKPVLEYTASPPPAPAATPEIETTKRVEFYKRLTALAGFQPLLHLTRERPDSNFVFDTYGSRSSRTISGNFIPTAANYRERVLYSSESDEVTQKFERIPAPGEPDFYGAILSGNLGQAGRAAYVTAYERMLTTQDKPQVMITDLLWKIEDERTGDKIRLALQEINGILAFPAHTDFHLEVQLKADRSAHPFFTKTLGLGAGDRVAGAQPWYISFGDESVRTNLMTYGDTFWIVAIVYDSRAFGAGFPEIMRKEYQVSIDYPIRKKGLSIT